MAEVAPSRAYCSPLEKHPKFVHAIGMISIENASLETLLGELLGALLGIHLHVGQILYFTPKAAIARIDLLSNVTGEALCRHSKLAVRVDEFLRRCKSAMGKRHEIVHSIWTENDFDETGSSVSRFMMPKWSGTDLKLTDLESLIKDFRKLIEEMAPLIADVQQARGCGYFPWGPYVAIQSLVAT